MCMQEIASQGHIKTEALIQHIINGVVDDPRQTILYYSTVHFTQAEEEV